MAQREAPRVLDGLRRGPVQSTPSMVPPCPTSFRQGRCVYCLLEVLEPESSKMGSIWTLRIDICGPCVFVVLCALESETPFKWQTWSERPVVARRPGQACKCLHCEPHGFNTLLAQVMHQLVSIKPHDPFPDAPTLQGPLCSTVLDGHRRPTIFHRPQPSGSTS